MKVQVIGTQPDASADYLTTPVPWETIDALAIDELRHVDAKSRAKVEELEIRALRYGKQLILTVQRVDDLREVGFLCILLIMFVNGRDQPMQFAYADRADVLTPH